MIERDPLSYSAMLAAMAAAVILCRIGGYWLLGRFSIGPRLRKILNALPGAVIASTIAPILVAAALTMIAVRNDFAALAAGVLIAAGARAAGL